MNEREALLKAIEAKRRDTEFLLRLRTSIRRFGVILGKLAR